MKLLNKLNFLALILMLGSSAHAGKIQNEDVKSQADIQAAVLTTTGNLSSGSPCIASPASTAGLVAGLFIYDSTTSANIANGATIVGLPGTCPSGQIQMSSNATATASGNTITFGGQLSQLINDTKIYVTANSINDTLYNAIVGSLLGGGAGFVNSVASVLLSGDNAGFEFGTSAWTNTGGSFSIDSSTPLYGAKSAVFTASGTGQFLQTVLRAVPIGLYGANCELDFSYKYSGTAGDYQAQVFDGTSVVASYALPTSATASDAALIFTCPSSGSLRVRFASTVASPGSLTVDGYSKNYGLISLGAQLPGSPKLAVGFEVGNCTGTASTSSTTFVDFPSQTGCAENTFFNNGFGSITANAIGFGPTLTFPRLGNYEVIVSFAGLDGGQGYQDQIVDGSNNVLQTGPTVSGSPAFYMQTIRGFYTVTSHSPVSFKIQGRSVNSTHAVQAALMDSFQWTIREL